MTCTITELSLGNKPGRSLALPWGVVHGASIVMLLSGVELGSGMPDVAKYV